MASDVQIIISARDLASQQMRAFTGVVETTTRRLDSMAASARRVSISAGAAFGSLAASILGAVKAADEEHRSMLRLESAILGTGKAISTARIAQLASELQDLTRYGDDAYVSASALLATFRLEEEQIVALLPRVANLAETYGMDLDQAAKTVGRSLTQGAGALSRYGISMTDAEKKAFQMANTQERVNMLLEIFDKVTGPSAERAVRSFGGAWDQLKNLVGDTVEAIGGIFSPTMTRGIRWMSEQVSDLRSFIGGLSEEQKQSIVQWTAMTAAVLGGVTALGLVVTAATIAGKAILSLATPITLGVGAVALFGALLYTAWTQDWGGIRAQLTELWTEAEPLMQAARELGHETLKTMWNWVVGGLDQLSYIVDDAWPIIAGIPETIIRAISWVVNGLADLAEGAALAVSKAVEWTINIVRGAWEVATEWVDRAIKWTVSTARGAWQVASEWLDRTVQWTVNTARGVWEVASEWTDRAVNWIVNTARGTWEIASEWLNKFVTWTIYTVAGVFGVPAEWVDKAVTWTVRTVRGVWEVASEWLDRAVTWVVNLAQGTADAVSGWFDVALTWLVNLAQGAVGTVSDWIDRAVTWIVNLVQGTIGAVSGWIDNAVSWVVNLIKGSAQAVSDWISPKLEWVARLVNVVAGAGSTVSEWFLNLVGGKAEPVTVDVPVEPSFGEGWGTRLNNWLATTLEGLQWQEISKEKFDQLRQEFGEQADQMLKQEGGKYYVRTSEKVEILMDMALGVATFMAGRATFAVGSTVFSVIQKALKSVLGLFMGDLIGGWAVPVAVGAAITWTLMPEDIREKIRGLFGLDLQSTVREAFPDVARLIDEQQLTEITDLVVKYADAYGFAKDQVAALVRQESDFRDVGNSLSTATGPLQVTQTALRDLARLGIDYDTSTLEGRVEAAIKYLQALRDHYKLTGDELIAAYYAGPTYIKEHGITDEVLFGQISPRQYVEEWKSELAKLQEAARLDLSEVLGLTANIALGVTIAANVGRKAWTLLQMALAAAGMKTSTLMAGMKAMGAPGVIAVVSIAADLLNQEQDWREMGVKLIAALAAGIGIGAFTGSPYMGALAFDIVYNLIPGRVVNFFKGLLFDTPEFEELPPAEREKRLRQVQELEDILTFPTLPRNHEGAILPGTDGPDKFLAMLAPGEAVVPSRAVHQGWPGVLEWFRSMGVPGFQSGKPPVIATGNPALDAQLSSTSSWLEGLGDSLTKLGTWIADTFISVFKEIGRTLVDIAKAVFPDQVAALEGVWAEVQRRFDELKNYLSGANDAIDDTTDTLNKGNEVAEKTITVWDEVLAVVSDWTKQLVSSVPGLKNAIEAYKTTTTSIDDGGKGLGIAAGITAAALELLTAHSKEFQEALGYVTEGLTMLIEPINVILRMLGPVGSGGLVGAGVGYGAASLLGINPLIGVVVGGLMGLFGGVAQQQAEAAELQIQAANELVQAARSMSTEARYGAIDEMRRSIADTEQTIGDLEASLTAISAAGAIGGAVAGYGAALLLGAGPVGLLIGALLGAAVGGGLTQAAGQRNIEETTKQLEAQRQALNQLVEDFKGALGITVSDLASSVRQAFSAETVEEFSARLGTSLMMHVRDALIAGFVESAEMRSLFETLSDQIFEAVRDGVTSAGELDAIRDTISQVSEQSTLLFEALDAVGLGLNDLNDAARAASSSLRNVPAGFKYALERYHAAEPMLIDQQSMANLRATIQDLGSSGGYVIDLRGSTFYGEGDFKAKIAKVMSELSRNNRSATTYAVRA